MQTHQSFFQYASTSPKPTHSTKKQNPDLKVLEAKDIQDAHRLKVFLAFDLCVNLANEP